MSVRVEERGGVVRITLVDPDGRNPLIPAVVKSATQGIAMAASSESCRAVVVAAEGASFCSGLDLARAAAPSVAFLQTVADLLVALHRCPVPVVAAVQGGVTGGGLGLVAASDIVLAHPDSTFMLSEVIVGMIPAVVAPFLRRRLAPEHVRHLAVSSRRIDAAEAKVLGLVDEVAPDVDGAVRRQLKQLFRSSPAALAATKGYLDALEGGALDAELAEALRRASSWLKEPTASEGIAAFAEGLAPPWFAKYRGNEG